MVVPLPDRARPAGRRRVVAWVAGVAAAAAVAVIAVLSVGLSHANDRVHQLQSATAAGSLHGELSAALANPAHQVVALRSPTGTVVAHVVLVPGGQAYLTDVTMPALAADETYQLWGSSTVVPSRSACSATSPGWPPSPSGRPRPTCWP